MKKITIWLVVGLLAAAGMVLALGQKTSYSLTFMNFASPDSSLQLAYGGNPELGKVIFFERVKEELIEKEVDFIEADLSAMRLQVYKGGKKELSVPILTKGRVGSWWETPAGIYKVETMEKNHFSSFGQVYMPWSMQFQGNFFIHGWPYYQGGKEVASAYSGGCIRLATEDAQKVWEISEMDMPVLVFEEDFKTDNFRPIEKKVVGVTAKNYLAADLNSGAVFLEQGAQEEVPIASLSKLLTALVTVEYVNLEKQVTVDERAIVSTSKPRLKEGESYRVFDLLFPLLLESSNEAAEALAGTLGRDNFIQKMNLKAKALGMEQAEFVDASGRGDGNVATAEDLFALGRYLYYNRKFILNLSAGKEGNNAYGAVAFYNLSNFNDLGIGGLVGGKVGQTSAAGETALMIYMKEINGQERPIMVSVLGSEDREGDVKKIIGYIEARY